MDFERGQGQGHRLLRYEQRAADSDVFQPVTVEPLELRILFFFKVSPLGVALFFLQLLLSVEFNFVFDVITFCAVRAPSTVAAFALSVIKDGLHQEGVGCDGRRALAVVTDTSKLKHLSTRWKF